MRMSNLELGICLGVALLLAACSADADNGTPADEAPRSADGGAIAAPSADATGYTVREVTNGGTIRGTVRFTGTVPPPRVVTVSEDTETCGTSHRIQTLEMGHTQGLANAVVSLVDITRGAAIEPLASPPTLDQRGCQFAPHVLLAPANKPVRVLNDDPLTHNVHTASFDNRPVNRSQPRSLREIEVTFRSTEKVRVKCDMHSWMSAWIIVVDHPYHTLTDETGSFALTNVPAGTYTLEVWHETAGSRSRTVTVTEGQATDASVELGEQS